MQGAESVKQKQNAFHWQSRKLTQTYAKYKTPQHDKWNVLRYI